MDKFPRKRPYTSRRTARSASVQKSPDQYRRLKKILLCIFLFFVLVWVFLVFLRSGFFGVEQIMIVGNTHTPEDEIIQILQVSPGDNILKLSLSRLEDSILTIPRVKSVEVKRQLPRTVYVEINEWDLLALVPYQEYFLEIGDNGQVLGSSTDTQSYELPLLTGLVPVTGTVGEYIMQAELLSEIQALSSALIQEGIHVSEINAAQEENLVVITLDGLMVWLGNKNYAEKTRILVQIIGQLSGRQSEGYLDLRVPTAPAFHILDSN